jgi:hypothetical protein
VVRTRTRRREDKGRRSWKMGLNEGRTRGKWLLEEVEGRRIFLLMW